MHIFEGVQGFPKALPEEEVFKAIRFEDHGSFGIRITACHHDSESPCPSQTTSVGFRKDQ